MWKSPSTTVWKAGWAPVLAWISMENRKSLAAPTVQTPKHPACCKLLYALHYPGPRNGQWSLLQHGPQLQLIYSFTFSHSTENLPFVMIWLGSNDSSPSFSPKHAYRVRTRLLEKEKKINVFKSKTGVFTISSCNHTCDTENHAHGALNKTRFHMKRDYFSTHADIFLYF